MDTALTIAAVLIISALGLLQGVAALDGHHIWAVYDDRTLELIGFQAKPITL